MMCVEGNRGLRRTLGETAGEWRAKRRPILVHQEPVCAIPARTKKNARPRPGELPLLGRNARRERGTAAGA
jgi:hypothetical protein